MPDFLPTTDGGRLRKADFAGARPVLLTFGAVTCPMTADADPKLKQMTARRDLLRQAPSTYATAKLAGLAWRKQRGAV